MILLAIPILLLLFIKTFVSSSTIVAKEDYWRELSYVSTLYPPSDPKLIKSFEARLELFRELVGLVTSKYQLKTSKFERDSLKDRILISGYPQDPIVWHTGRLTVVALLAFLSQNTNVTINEAIKVGQILIKKWHRLSPSEISQGQVIVGKTDSSFSSMPLMFDFTERKDLMTGTRDCFIQEYNVQIGRSVSECFLTIVCFDPKQTQVLSAEFKEKLERTTEDSTNHRLDTKQVFGRTHWDPYGLDIFLPILDASIRVYAGKEARKLADSPKMITKLFWQIYGQLMMKIIPKGGKFYNPEQFLIFQSRLQLQDLSEYYYYSTNAHSWNMQELNKSLPKFTLQNSKGHQLALCYKGQKGAIAIYLGPFVASPLSWPVPNSPAYVKRHRLPLEWLSTVILMPQTQNDDQILIRPDRTIMDILLRIDDFNETLLKWQNNFIQFHLDLPKLIHPIAINTNKQKNKISLKVPVKKAFDTSNFYEWIYLLNDKDDRTNLYTYKDAPVIMPVALVSYKKRALNRLFGLPLQAPGIITSEPQFYHALLVNSYHAVLPQNLPVFEVHSQVS